MTLRPRSALFDDQRNAAHRIARRGSDGQSEVALLADIGFGKTAATLTGLLDADAFPALVIAPARVAESTWANEAQEWEHLAGLKVRFLGTGKERRKLLESQADIETTSYESLVGQPDHPKRPFTGLTDEVRLEDRYKAIVFDELDKVKTPGTRRFRRLRAHAESIPVRVGLTGSPVPCHLLDLWGEMFMVAGEKPLGSTYSGFQRRYFETIDYFQRVWRLKGMAKDGEHTVMSAQLEREIHQRIAPFCFVPPAPPPDRVPPVRVNEINVPMPASVQRKQQQLVDELFTTLDSGTEIEALQKSALSAKLQQFASGAVYTDSDGSWEEVHSEKIGVLDDMLSELQGEPLLIFFWFKHEVERITAMLRRTGRTFATMDEPDAVKRWNARQLEVLLAHPQSDGRGLNLQHGGHHTCWFTLPWAPVLWFQGNGRLARTGQTAAFVTASCLLCGPADVRVLSVLRARAAVQEALFRRLRADVSDLI